MLFHTLAFVTIQTRRLYEVPYVAITTWTKGETKRATYYKDHVKRTWFLFFKIGLLAQDG